MSDTGGFFGTKERGAAWIFRGLLTLIMMLCTIVGWFGTRTLSGLDQKLNDVDKSTWSQITVLSKTEAELNTALAGLTATVNDHLHTDIDQDQNFKSLLQDHEIRIRTLEHSKP